MKYGILLSALVGLTMAASAEQPRIQYARPDIKAHITYRCQTESGSVIAHVIVTVKIGSFLSVEDVVCGEPL
jgi:hypothetical protein